MHMRTWLGALLLALLLPTAALAEDPAPTDPAPTPAAPTASPDAPAQERKTRAFTGLIRKVSETELVVQQIGNARRPGTHQHPER